MVFCGVCKQECEAKNNWVIQEHSVDNSLIHNFRVCDSCAASLIRRIVREMKLPVSDENVVLNHTGIIGNVVLNSKDELEITLLMDLAKARKVVLENVELDS